MFIEFEKVYYREDYPIKGKYEFQKRSIRKKELLPTTKKVTPKAHTNRDLKKLTIDSYKKIMRMPSTEERKTPNRKPLESTDTFTKIGSLKNFTKLNLIEVLPKEETMKPLPKITILNYTVQLEELDDKRKEKMKKIEMLSSKRLK
jgi:hypothetical protein